MKKPALTFHIPAPVPRPAKGLWDQQAHQVVQDSEDLKDSEVNRGQRDQMGLEVQ